MDRLIEDLFTMLLSVKTHLGFWVQFLTLQCKRNIVILKKSPKMAMNMIEESLRGTELVSLKKERLRYISFLFINT